ncbi:MAG: CotH kinase family protein [Prolixibacteraceae bacterium]|nr:CotH kinase family protein [Prolixibacteraceae bacterium]
MKNTFIKIFAFLVLLFGLFSCYQEFPYVPEIHGDKPALFVNYNEVILDSENELALLSVANFEDFNGLISYNKYNRVSIDLNYISNGSNYDFENIDSGSSFKLSIVDSNNLEQHYTLKLTLLPVIHISQNFEAIKDEPKIIAHLNVQDPQGKSSINEYCGIEFRGGSANGQPKKSYGFEIYDDAESMSSKNMRLLGMYNDDDWILDASYIDKANTRNRVSFDLWSDIQNDAEERGNTVLYSATKGQFVELFVNNSYKGLYCLNERVDAKMLGLKSSISSGGLLYKSEEWSSATTFSGVPDTANFVETWAGWEQKYPSPNTFSYWKPLYDYVDFVSNSSDSDFEKQIFSNLSSDQAIDYFILMNMIYGLDNAGKNILLAKLDVSQPFFMCPWDMDATWGRNWKGEEYTANDLVTFNLYKRLSKTAPDNYELQLKNRWNELREEVLTLPNIVNKFESYQQLFIEAGAYQRELETWPESMPNIYDELIYIETWLEKRIAFLDNYFESL